MTIEPDRFDYVLKDLETGYEYGYLVDWANETESPFQLVVQEQSPPDSMAGTDDELYSYRDLLDSWRVFFTDFTGGQGQYTRDTADSVPSQYWESYNVDISKPGYIKLAPAVDIIDVGAAEIGAQVIVALGGIVYSMRSLGAPQIKLLKEGVTYTSTGITDSGPVTALATDGEYVYAGIAGAAQWGIWRGDFEGGTWEKWSDLSGIGAITFSGGYCYVIQGSTPGYIKADGGLQALDIAAIHKPTLTTFGITTIGNWVYWGVTNGTRTWVYALQHNIVEGDKFELYAELPSGFVGTSLDGCLGSLFIAGYKASDRGEYGQGLVYIATPSGVARLVTIGEDPNELETGDPALITGDYDNRIVALTDYHDWLYILTTNKLFRWDLNDGGLSHFCDIGAYLNTRLGSPLGENPSAPAEWDPDFHYDSDWGVEWFDSPDWGDPVQTVLWQRSKSDFTYSLSTAGHIRYEPNTSDKYGDRRWVYYESRPVSTPSASTIRLITTTLRYQALEFGLKTATNGLACVHVYGNVLTDKFKVRLRDSDGVWRASADLDNRNAQHTFWLTNNGTVANLWVDGIQLFTDVPLWNDIANNAAVFWGAGWGVFTDTISVKDWYLTLVASDVCLEEALVPDYIPPTAALSSATTFASLYDEPFIPANWTELVGGVPTLKHALITTDRSSYVSEGYLLSSWSSSRMPTVSKTFTSVDVHHHELANGDEVYVYYEIDETPPGELLTMQTPEIERLGSADGEIAVIDPGTTHNSGFINEVGRRVRVRIKLVSGDLSTSPRVRAVSLRWSAPPKNIVQLLTVFKDRLRDFYKQDYDPTPSYNFLSACAKSGQVVGYEMFGEEGYARVTAVQFTKALPSGTHRSAPQGTAVVRLTEVQR